MIAERTLADENREIETSRAALQQQDPLPSAALMYRVAHIRGAYSFIGSDVVNVFEILPTLLPHLTGPAQHLQDWGCGCGRLRHHLIPSPHFTTYTGCDIDAEAIKWCSAHLDGGRFLSSAPAPPISLPDASFNVVIS